MNYQTNDIIDCVCRYFNRIDLLMFSHTNKRFITHSQKYLLRHKNHLSSGIISSSYPPTFDVHYKHTMYIDYVPEYVILCANAAFYGYLDILMYLRENKCSWDPWVCAYAALNGHLEVLKWLRKNGCYWSRWTCTFAAYNGHLEILKWAIKNGCYWDTYTCSDNAAIGGHLNVLIWIKENGRWNRNNCLTYAKQNNHKEMI